MSMSNGASWSPDPRSNAQLQAQWVELRKAGMDCRDLEEASRIREQMESISAELEERRKRNIVV
jgi:hypothetical protein